MLMKPWAKVLVGRLSNGSLGLDTPNGVQKSSHLGAGYSKWSPKDAFKMLAPLEDICIFDTVTHTSVNGDKVETVLHPPDFR